MVGAWRTRGSEEVDGIPRRPNVGLKWASAFVVSRAITQSAPRLQPPARFRNRLASVALCARPGLSGRRTYRVMSFSRFLGDSLKVGGTCVFCFSHRAMRFTLVCSLCEVRGEVFFAHGFVHAPAAKQVRQPRWLCLRARRTCNKAAFYWSAFSLKIC